MGRLAIIFVVGLAFAFGIVAWSLSRSNIQTVETSMGYHKYSTARNIARSAINLKFRNIDDNKPITETITGSMMGGQYTVDSIFARNDSIGLRSVAIFNDSVYRIRTIMQRTPKPFPNISAAVGICVNDAKLLLMGNALVNGFNHTINGVFINPTIPANNKTGLEVMIPPDSVEASKDNDKIFGFPTKIRINPLMENPGLFVHEYIMGANFYYGPGTYSAKITWGSIDNPVIVYCDGRFAEVHFSGQCEGWGILIVRGSLKATGQFTWRGLVVPFSDTIIDFDPFSGQAEIIGAILMGGATGSTFALKGQGTVKYSSDALDKAKMIGQLMFYKILTWYEGY